MEETDKKTNDSCYERERNIRKIVKERRDKMGKADGEEGRGQRKMNETEKTKRLNLWRTNRK
jgi:hypothetical protein